MRDRIQGVIFDCDGTLVDSESISCMIAMEMMAEEGLHLSYDETMVRFAGRKLAESLDIVEREFGRPLRETFSRELRDRMVTRFHDELEPMEGAADLLASLAVPFCIASNGPMAKMRLTLARTGLAGYFGDLVFSAYELNVWKPDPGLFLHAAGAMNVNPAACAVVEDSESGIRAGLSAGMHVYALGHDPGQFDGSGRMTRIDRLSDLSAYLPFR